MYLMEDGRLVSNWVVIGYLYMYARVTVRTCALRSSDLPCAGFNASARPQSASASSNLPARVWTVGVSAS